jgi:hypothetical protein
VRGGDDRYYNNIFVGNGPAQSTARRPVGKNLEWISSFGLWGYDTRDLPLRTGGNLYLNGAEPYRSETDASVLPNENPMIKLAQSGGQFVLRLVASSKWKETKTSQINTEKLGKATTPDLPYENPDTTPIQIATDYLGQSRNPAAPTPGPFENLAPGPMTLQVW